MASKSNQNKRPLNTTTSTSSPFNSRQIGDGVQISKKRKLVADKMVGTASTGRNRKAFSDLNGSEDVGPDVTPAGLECSVLEFTKETVEALLNEKSKVKGKFKDKERCEEMKDYIKRLRQCVRHFQQLQGNFETEQEDLRNKMESSEQQRAGIEKQLRNKEEELNSIIMELRKNYATVTEKLSKEESEKLEAMDLLAREKEARSESERSRVSLAEELRKAQRDLENANQQISSLTDTHRRAQEYNVSLQQYNSKLQTDLETANDNFKRSEKEKAAIMENLSALRHHNKLLQEQLTSITASYENVMRQKDELVNDVACLRKDLQQTRDDRDRQLLQVKELTVDNVKYKESTAKSDAQLDMLTKKSKELEETCALKSIQIRTLESQLAAAEKKLQMCDLSALETQAEYEAQKKLISDLQTRLADAEFKMIEGEKLRKKLHNTILELKGNIRVFCRVRPLLPDEKLGKEGKVISFPTSTEVLGRGVELLQNGQKHSFTFDKVFMPDETQEDVFAEISQLIQSALDGYKVCIFAYGQTGSGKTYTMMGRPGTKGQKGLIPRTLEQIFQTTKFLESQGWRYEMQVSMLEIYNETIRDLLTTRSSVDTLRVENGAAAKQHAIKHDGDGNTYISDLTVVDVKSTNEVSFLLDQAAQSRSVGKTQMNDYSSRSHFVFTLKIFGVNENTYQQVQGVLNLIDLAGSERISKSGSTGDRLKETQAINKSLSALGDVIFSLAKKEDHVPFRNSKLTYLLQPCLGGDSKTLMFVNVSPDPSSVNESLCSLRFAARVNSCEIGIPRRQSTMRSSDSRMSYG